MNPEPAKTTSTVQPKGEEKPSTSKVATIVNQLSKLRDVDSETSKPRIQKPTANKPATPETAESPAKPKKTAPTESHKILELYLNYPLNSVKQPATSKYVPCSINMYHIVHLMDDIMRKNFYFRRQEDAWHPLVSRLYFGFAFIIQTVRAEVASGIATYSRRQFYNDFVASYPLEDFPIPGPLVTLFESLVPGTTESSLEALIVPSLPEELGPRQASLLLNLDAEHCYQLIIPNIPMILGFINTITTAVPPNIPNYSLANTFNNAADRNLNGHIFIHQAWTDTERTSLMTPGLLYPTESDPALDTSFNLFGARIGFPLTNADSDLRDIADYTSTRLDNEWFGKILTVMTTYCDYFKDSTTLAACSNSRTVSPVITSHYNTPLAPDRANSLITGLTHAFPASNPFSLRMHHTTTERELPPTSTMLAQTAALNVSFAAPTYPIWSSIGEPDITRFGPYWDKSPVHAQTAPEDTFKGLGALVKRHYAKSRPSDK